MSDRLLFRAKDCSDHEEIERPTRVLFQMEVYSQMVICKSKNRLFRRCRSMSKAASMHASTHSLTQISIQLIRHPPMQPTIYPYIYSVEYWPDLLRQKAARVPKTSQMSLRKGAIETGTIGIRPVKTSAPVSKTSPSDSTYIRNNKKLCI